jgi:hypothetical protein
MYSSENISATHISQLFGGMLTVPQTYLGASAGAVYQNVFVRLLPVSGM